MKRYDAKTGAWAEQWGCCWDCGKRGAWPNGGLQIHHIVRGTSKKADDLATTVILCSECHYKEHNCCEHVGLIGMLALKLHYDPAHYNLARVLNAERQSHHGNHPIRSRRRSGGLFMTSKDLPQGGKP